MKKLIVDTNILISALMKDSTTRNIIFHFPGKLYFINFSKEEIRRYEIYILNKIQKDDAYKNEFKNFSKRE